MSILLEYAIPSAFEASESGQSLGLVTNARRPVRFHAGVRPAARLPLRLALSALGRVIWSEDTWLPDGERMWILDPVITVHPDRIFFEAFSSDQSAYGIVIADPAQFETEGDVQYGTTNVDFTAALAAALDEMRSSRETRLRIGPQGLAVSTANAGGRFQEKVEIPESWVRGFLQLQSAMAHPGTRFDVRPVDLLSAVRYLSMNKAKVSPRAMRYEFEPGAPARLVLEPWEHAITLKGAEHNYGELRTIRTWGRRGLKLIEPLLPYADGATVYLKGRAMPSFYALRLDPGITFVLGLSGWGGSKFSSGGGLDLGTEMDEIPQAALDRAAEILTQRVTLTVPQLAEAMGVAAQGALPPLTRLCRLGRAIYDVERREFRHRELFEEPVEETKYFPPDARRERLRAIIAGGLARLDSCTPRETAKQKKFRNPETGERFYREIILRDWQYAGSAGDQGEVEAVVNDEGRLIFGKCGCQFFLENYLNLGPCEHIAALRHVGEASRRDLPSSVESSAAREQPPKEDSGGEDEDESED